MKKKKSENSLSSVSVVFQFFLHQKLPCVCNSPCVCCTTSLRAGLNLLIDAVDALDENHVTVTDEEFVDFFNAWMLSICDMATALGHTINDTVRLKVCPNHGGYGLDKDWEFSKVIHEIMDWSDGNETEMAWKRVLKEVFLDSAQPDSGKLIH